MALNYITIILSVITIFLFKKRILQYKLTNLLVVLNVIIAGLFFTLSFQSDFSEPLHYGFGAFLPFIGATFAFLAAYFIKKDEQLVRSTDRIR